MRKATMKVFAARGQLNRNPDLNPFDLIGSLEIGKRDESIVLYLAVKSAYETENDTLTLKHLQACLKTIDTFSPMFRRELSRMSMENKELALAFIEDVECPTLHSDEISSRDEDLRRRSHQVILHASLRARLRGSRQLQVSAQLRPSRRVPTKAGIAWKTLGGRLVKTGARLVFLTEFEAFLDFLQRAEGRDSHDFDRWTLNRVMDEAITAMVDTAAILGKDVLQHFSEGLDARLANDAGRFNRPRRPQGLCEGSFPP